MSDTDVIIAACETNSAFGAGRDLFCNALFSGKRAFTGEDRFQVSQFRAQISAHVPGIHSAFDLLLPLAETASLLPEQAPLFFTSTVGEINHLSTTGKDTVLELFERAKDLFHTKNGRIISAACAGGNMAVIRAAEAIRSQKIPYALVVGCDIVSEFVFSGFASLDALSEEPPKPYDAARNGLVLGDGAGILVLTSRKYAGKNHLPVLAHLENWGASCDAEHITAPSSSGAGLAAAIRAANRNHEPAGAIIGHGTGTIFNDAMEIEAVRSVFPEQPPLASVKGASGHTLAAAGLLQAAAALESLKRRELFPQPWITDPIASFISKDGYNLKYKRVLSMNAGFGGLNAVLQLSEGGAQ